MRYKVEYVNGEQQAMVYERYVYVDELADAADIAWEDAWYAKRYHNADGFRIVDLFDQNRVAALERFEGVSLPSPPHERAQSRDNQRGAALSAVNE